jgi:hypothetical protein
MTIFNIAADATWDDAAFATRAGNDTYTLIATAAAKLTLTIDTDTRYCENSDATKGAMGNVNLSGGGVPTAGLCGELLIDGSKVRLIPYDTGAGLVPAYPTAITQGGVSAVFLGVWSAFNVAPTAAGAAMPLTGYIKVKNVTGGVFAAGALGGIGANATGADTVGWIEVVGTEALTLTANGNNKLNIQGEWFEHSTLVTTGLSGSTYQLPASLANTYFGGVWVETAAASGVYDFYPSAGSLVAANSVASDAVRGKICWISSQGLVRLGSDGTNTNGYLPVVGCKIRIPNIITLNSVAAASVNAVPNATITQRFETAFTAAGIVDINRVTGAWYFNFQQARSLTIQNSSFLDGISVVEIGSPFTLTQVGVAPSLAGTTAPVQFVVNRFGGTVTDCCWVKPTHVASVPAVLMTNCSGIDFVRDRVFYLAERTLATAHTHTITSCDDCTWTDCTYGTSDMLFQYSYDLTITDLIWYDVLYGRTPGVTNANGIFSIGVGTHDCLFDGLSFGGLEAVAPASHIWNMPAVRPARITIRNVGTPAAPLDLGGPTVEDVSWTRVTTTATITSVGHGLQTGDSIYVSISSVPAAIILGLKLSTVIRLTDDTFTITCLNAGAASGTLSYNLAITNNAFPMNGSANGIESIVVQRVYLRGAKTSCLPLMLNDQWGFVLDNVWGNEWNPCLPTSNNMAARGMLGSPTLAAQTAVRGTHWIDGFNSRLSPTTTAQAWTRVTTTATVTSVGHDLHTGDVIHVTASSDEAAITLLNAAATQTVTVIDSNTFTIVCLNAGAAAGTLDYENLSGFVGMQMNEWSAETVAQVSIDAGTPRFTNVGTISMPTVGDQVTWTMPDYCLGHTAFPDVIPWSTITQANWANFDWQYQIDKNDGAGFSGWKNALYNQTGDTTLGGFTIFNIPDTSQLAVGDYVFRSNAPTFTFGVNAKIVSIDSPTQVTLDQANAQTAVGIPILFRQYPNEVLDAQLGFKLKFRCTTCAANTVLQAFFALRTSSTAVSRALQYPLIPPGPYGLSDPGVTYIS